MGKRQYKEGMDMKLLSPLDTTKSHYNHNYYVGINDEILVADSNDDNETEWNIVGNNRILLGYSYTTEGDLLHFADIPHT